MGRRGGSTWHRGAREKHTGTEHNNERIVRGYGFLLLIDRRRSTELTLILIYWGLGFLRLPLAELSKYASADLIRWTLIVVLQCSALGVDPFYVAQVWATAQIVKTSEAAFMTLV